MDAQWAPCGQCDCIDGVSPIPHRWEIKGLLRTSSCPRQASTDVSWQWIHLFQHYRNGLLWSAGGLSDQPNIYLEAMQLIDTWGPQLRE